MKEKRIRLFRNTCKLLKDFRQLVAAYMKGREVEVIILPSEEGTAFYKQQAERIAQLLEKGYPMIVMIEQKQTQDVRDVVEKVLCEALSKSPINLMP